MCIEVFLKSKMRSPLRVCPNLLPPHPCPAAASASGAGAPAGGAGAGAAPLLDGPGRYELEAIISHMGQNTACGHYVCHVK